MWRGFLHVMDRPWWRAIEGVHTIVWVIAGLFSLSSFALGWVQKVPAFWLVSVPITLLAASVFLGERAYWRFGYCPLPEAATKVYDALKDTTDVGAFSAGYGGDPNYVLDEVATAISLEVPIYGKQPPATTLDEIPKIVFPQGGFVDGGSKFKKHNTQSPHYIDLSVRRADVGRAIRAIGQNYAELHKG